MKFLRLIRIVIVRNIKEEKFLTFLSILGIALGIALFTGIKVASDRAITSFERDIQGINPQINYEIFDASGIDFNEIVYKEVRTVESKSIPVLKTFGYLPAFSDTIDINGIYTAKAIGLFRSSSRKNIDLESFYRTINGVLITKRFAEKHSIQKGETFSAQVYDRVYSLNVVDIIQSDLVLANTFFMDIGNFQEYFEKTGYLSRIDLISDEPTAEELAKILPISLKVVKKERVFANQKSLVASFRYNLQFVSLIAILVGLFLLYNTVFITVVKRRTEIGILRGLGADKKTIIMLFAIQGVVLGIVGSVIGILLGQFAAYFSVIAVEKTISTMYSTVSISDYLITKRDILISLAVGLFVSLLASFIPALEASKIRPNESSREGSFEDKYKKYQVLFFSAGFLFVTAGIILSYIDYRSAPFEFPVLAYIGILFIIAGFTFFSPFYLRIFLRIVRKPLESIFKSIGKITLGDIRGNTYRFSVALMSVAISGALIVALLTLIFSFRSSLMGWIHKNITADVYIKPASCKSNYCFYPMSEEVIDIVKRLPEVEGVDKFRGLSLELFGKKVVTGFADVGVKRKYLERKYIDREYEGILQEMEGKEPVVGISDYLSLKYGKKVGDILNLQTPKGKKEFRINDVFSSYSTTSGFLYIDRRWLRDYWGMDDATQISVYLREDADVALFIHKLRGILSAYSLEIMNNQELRTKVLNIFDKSFAITYAIELISIVVSLIGIINTLLAMVFERKREISIIRYLGGSWRQIQQNLVLAAGIVGISGILLGMLLGPLMSIIFIHVVNKISFGWTIHFKIPFVYLSIVTVILFSTTLLAGLLPSKVARKIEPKRFVSFE